MGIVFVCCMFNAAQIPLQKFLLPGLSLFILPFPKSYMLLISRIHCPAMLETSVMEIESTKKGSEDTSQTVEQLGNNVLIWVEPFGPFSILWQLTVNFISADSLHCSSSSNIQDEESDPPLPHCGD